MPTLILKKSFEGHKGIPGHQGGSLPRDGIELIDKLRSMFHVATKIAYVDYLKDDFGTTDNVVGQYDPSSDTVLIATAIPLKISTETFGTVLNPDDAPMIGLRSTASLGPGALIIHEMTHAFDHVGQSSWKANYSDSDTFKQLYKEYYNGLLSVSAKKDDVARGISRYSLTNTSECFAETMVAYMLNPDWLAQMQPKLYDYMTKLPYTDVAESKEIQYTFYELAKTDGTYEWVSKPMTVVKKGDQGIQFAPTQNLTTSPERLNTVKIGRNAVKGTPGRLGVLKSFPGHKGIPGHQGGSLPENDVSIPQQLIDGISSDEAITMTLPISAITISKQQGIRTLIDIQDNRKAYSKGKIVLYYDVKHKQFLVDDGNHRLLEAIMAGKKTITAKVYSGYGDLRPVYDGEEKFDFNSLHKPKTFKEQHTGAMVAFDMSDDPMAKDIEEAHVTLVYLGEADTIQDSLDGLYAELHQFSIDHAPVSGEFAGMALFSASTENDGKAPVVTLFDSAALPAFRQALLHAIANVIPSVLEQTHGFTAHMTLNYTDKPEVTLPITDKTYSKTFNKITLYVGGDKTDYTLAGNVVEKQLIGRLKSFPGHKGIPGHQGGSLPKGDEAPTIESSFAMVMDKWGDKNGFVSIPLHRTDYLELLPANVQDILKTLPYSEDNVGQFHYEVRKADQIINLKIWKNEPAIGVLKSFPNHLGRPGLQGGSLPATAIQDSLPGELTSYHDMPDNLYKSYLVTGDGRLVHMPTEHALYPYQSGQPELFGMTADEAKSFYDQYEKSGGTANLDNYWQKFFSTGNIRLLEYGDEVDIETAKLDRATLQRIQRLVDEDKIVLKNKIIWTSVDTRIWNSFTPEEFMSAKYVKIDDRYNLILKSKPHGILKSFPDHQGIPGHQGGSLPRDASASKHTKTRFYTTSIPGKKFVSRSALSGNIADWGEYFRVFNTKLTGQEADDFRDWFNHKNMYPDTLPDISGRLEGSLPKDENAVIATNDSYPGGLAVYAIKDASKLVSDGYITVAVQIHASAYGKKGDIIASREANEHGSMLMALGYDNIDAYVRFYVTKGKLIAHRESSGTASDDEAIILNNIYKACDYLIANGLPDTTPLVIQTYNTSARVIRTTVHKELSKKLVGKLKPMPKP